MLSVVKQPGKFAGPEQTKIFPLQLATLEGTVPPPQTGTRGRLERCFGHYIGNLDGGSPWKRLGLGNCILWGPSAWEAGTWGGTPGSWPVTPRAVSLCFRAPKSTCTHTCIHQCANVLSIYLSHEAVSPRRARTESGFVPTVTRQNARHIVDTFKKYLLNEKVDGWMDRWTGWPRRTI